MTPEELATELERLSALNALILFHETGGHEGDGSDETLSRAKAELAALKAAELPDDVAGLVAKLRRRGNRHDDGAMMHGELVNPDGPEAAAAITALSRQVAERDAVIARLNEAYPEAMAAADAENQRLRDALTVAQGRLYWCGVASPGCADKAGRKLALEWSEETGRALDIAAIAASKGV